MTTNGGDFGFPGGDLLVGALALGLTAGVVSEVGKSFRSDSGELESQKEKNAKLKRDLAKLKRKKSQESTKAKSKMEMGKVKTAPTKSKNKSLRARGGQGVRRR